MAENINLKYKKMKNLKYKKEINRYLYKINKSILKDKTNVYSPKKENITKSEKNNEKTKPKLKNFKLCHVRMNLSLNNACVVNGNILKMETLRNNNNIKVNFNDKNKISFKNKEIVEFPKLKKNKLVKKNILNLKKKIDNNKYKIIEDMINKINSINLTIPNNINNTEKLSRQKRNKKIIKSKEGKIKNNKNNKSIKKNNLSQMQIRNKDNNLDIRKKIIAKIRFNKLNNKKELFGNKLNIINDRTILSNKNSKKSSNRLKILNKPFFKESSDVEEINYTNRTINYKLNQNNY